ncbi:MAG: rRNA ((2251)-2-O)-methyltransferase RlmB [Verrucomicrobiaceae bacterium]|nr:rRNA ((2251)-2-O)-methyltransferase RlmB [Verrucomicrobiaceae bacterium]
MRDVSSIANTAMTESNSSNEPSAKSANTNKSGDSSNYVEKKAFYDSLLTIYGRKPVLEALQDSGIPIFCVHLADSNKTGDIVRDIEQAAAKRSIPIKYHSKIELSRISKNSREDQGVAADLQLQRYQRFDNFLKNYQPDKTIKIIALDRITNPQNMGMLIRSACAGGVDAVLIPEKGSAPLSPLVIKASAGTLFKCPIVRCADLAIALQQLKQCGMEIGILSSHAEEDLFALPKNRARVYILGNETDGVSPEIMQVADLKIRIPMHNGVESLNVAVTAALLAYYG